MGCHILIAHNINFDNNVIQAEYNRNKQINWIGRHRKIEYCTMKYGMKFTKIMRPSKYNNGTWQKPPKLMELHEKLFKTIPNNLHNSMIDVFVCFRCFYQMVYTKDIMDIEKNPELTRYYNNLCAL